MKRVEPLIQRTIQKRGKITVDKIKLEMNEQIEQQAQAFEANLTQRFDDTFQDATSVLDQTTMQIGVEMEGAVAEFQNDMQRQVKRLQTRAMHGIKPMIQDLHDELTLKITKEIQATAQEATDDLHINQGRLTTDAEERIRRHTEETRRNAEELRIDLRRAAETLQSEIQDRHQQAPISQPATPERSPVRSAPHRQAPATQPDTPTRNPYQRAPPVSPYHDVTIPTEETWNQMVSKCKEKVTLTYALPHDVKELSETQAEAFYRQIESNFKGYPAVRLQRFEALHRRGQSIPAEYAMGWPPEYVDEGSTILYEKLTETIPHSMTTLRNILITHQSRRDGYVALMTMMKRSIPRLGQLPPKMEPTWPKGVTPTEYANTLRNYIDQQVNYGRTFCDFEIASTIAQRAMEHHEYYHFASNRVAHLVQMATGFDNFQEIILDESEAPIGFATLLESYHQNSSQHQVNMLNGSLFINKFERGGNNGRGNSRPPRDGTRDSKPRELCPCCLRHGHNVEKCSVC